MGLAFLYTQGTFHSLFIFTECYICVLDLIWNLIYFSIIQWLLRLLSSRMSLLILGPQHLWRFWLLSHLIRLSKGGVGVFEWSRHFTKDFLKQWHQLSHSVLVYWFQTIRHYKLFSNIVMSSIKIVLWLYKVNRDVSFWCALYEPVYYWTKNRQHTRYLRRYVLGLR